jgi:hypothetical protein
VTITSSSIAVGSTANAVVYANTTNALVTSSNLTFNGTTFTTANDASIHGITVGLGTNSIANNTVVGSQALYSNVSGTVNNAFGQSALYSNQTGGGNTAIGNASLYTNVSGSNNVAVGQQALATSTVSNNTAVGYQTLRLTTSGTSNTAIGYQAGYTNQAGSYNTFVGFQAGYLTNGTGNTLNTFVGQSAGYNVTTGTKNTYIGTYNGNQNGLNLSTADNYIVLSDGDGNIGAYCQRGSTNKWSFGATIDMINTARVNIDGSGLATSLNLKGNNVTTPAGAYVWNATTTGDGQFFSFGTEASYTERGSITYNRTGGLIVYNTTSDYRAKTVNGLVQNALSKVALLKPSTGRMNGATQDIDFFVAHELQEVVPSAVIGEKDAVNEDNTPKLQMVDKSALIPLLTASIQELSALVTAQSATITSLTERITALENK